MIIPDRRMLKNSRQLAKELDSDIEERECTEIDDEDLLSRAEDGSPVVEGAAAVNHSTLGASRDTDISRIPDEGSRCGGRGRRYGLIGAGPISARSPWNANYIIPPVKHYAADIAKKE
jgi:hypothetical protein